MMIYLLSKSGCKGIRKFRRDGRNSDIFTIHIYIYAITKILPLKIPSHVFARHSGSRRCTTTPNLVIKGREVQKLVSEQSPDTPKDGQKD